MVSSISVISSVSIIVIVVIVIIAIVIIAIIVFEECQLLFQKGQCELNSEWGILTAIVFTILILSPVTLYHTTLVGATSPDSSIPVPTRVGPVAGCGSGTRVSTTLFVAIAAAIAAIATAAIASKASMPSQMMLVVTMAMLMLSLSLSVAMVMAFFVAFLPVAVSFDAVATMLSV
jgi:hypothetical protein